MNGLSHWASRKNKELDEVVCLGGLVITLTTNLLQPNLTLNLHGQARASEVPDYNSSLEASGHLTTSPGRFGLTTLDPMVWSHPEEQPYTVRTEAGSYERRSRSRSPPSPDDQTARNTDLEIAQVQP